MITIAAAFGISRIAFTQEAVSEHLWLLYYDLPKTAPVVHGIRFPILLTFVISGLTFVPLGQVIGQQLDVFRNRGDALRGYCWDLFGSLVGVAGFAVASFMQLSAWVWFAVIFAASLLFLRRVNQIAAQTSSTASPISAEA